jgi:hypothetical protein
MKKGTGSTTCRSLQLIHLLLVVPVPFFIRPAGGSLQRLGMIGSTGRINNSPANQTGLMEKGTGSTTCRVFASTHPISLAVPVPFFISLPRRQNKLGRCLSTTQLVKGGSSLCDKFADQAGVFAAGRGLNAAGRIDGGRADNSNRFGDVVRPKSAGQNQGQRLGESRSSRFTASEGSCCITLFSKSQSRVRTDLGRFQPPCKSGCVCPVYCLARAPVCSGLIGIDQHSRR